MGQSYRGAVFLMISFPALPAGVALPRFGWNAFLGAWEGHRRAFLPLASLLLPGGQEHASGPLPPLYAAPLVFRGISML